MYKCFDTYPKDDSSIIISIHQKCHVKMHKEKRIDAEPYQLKNRAKSVWEVLQIDEVIIDIKNISVLPYVHSVKKPNLKA